MSHLTRGASVLAALVLIAFLGVIALVVNFFSPIRSSSPSVSLSTENIAQVAAADVTSTAPGVRYGDVTGELGRKGAYTAKCESGMDYTLFYSQNGVVNTNLSQARNRCQAGTPSGAYPGGVIGWSEGESLQQFLDREFVDAEGNKKKYRDYFESNGLNGNLTDAHRTCAIKSGSNPPVWEINHQWKCLMRVCIPVPGNESHCDIYAVAQGQVNERALFAKQVEFAVGLATVNLTDERDTTAADLYARYSLSTTRIQTVLDDYLSRQDDLDERRASLAESYEARLAALQELASAEQDYRACSTAECRKALEQDLAAARTRARETEAAYARLRTEAVAVAPPERPADCTATDTRPECRGSTMPPPGVRTPPPGQEFREPPPSQRSPFGTFAGQSCTPGYVCQGNTLYYRGPAQMGGTASCMMQPMQQCQYGCAGLAGLGGSGTNNTFSQVGLGIQLISTLSSLFGGGGSGLGGMSSMAMSSSCATQPQNQQQGQYGTGTNGQACQQPPQQPPASSCTSGSWQPTSQTGNGCVTGWQCVPNQTTAAGAPKATLSCQPKTADVGMSISITYACENSTESTGEGFNTTAPSGTTVVTVQPPPTGANSVTYSLVCKNQGQTAGAQCKIDLSKPSIVLVANPKTVKNGESSAIGWITTGMQSCKISNTDFADWTRQNDANRNVNGAVQSPPITKNTLFLLTCVTNGGQTKEATVPVIL
ncbi:MAG: hypothetical protein RIQ56_744 [Candidatus Parcubacteria bacterium]